MNAVAYSSSFSARKLICNFTSQRATQHPTAGQIWYRSCGEMFDSKSTTQKQLHLNMQSCYVTFTRIPHSTVCVLAGSALRHTVLHKEQASLPSMSKILGKVPTPSLCCLLCQHTSVLSQAVCCSEQREKERARVSD